MWFAVSYKRIKSLRNPAVKMSKSDVDRLSCILLTDSADCIREKVRKAVTDMTPRITYDPHSRPAISNLVDIASAFTGLTVDEVLVACEQFDTVDFKNYLGEAVVERLRPIRAEITRLMGDVDYLNKVITAGNERARLIAGDTYTDVCRRVGLR